jgi:hypothetical protein
MAERERLIPTPPRQEGHDAGEPTRTQRRDDAPAAGRGIVGDGQCRLPQMKNWQDATELPSSRLPTGTYPEPCAPQRRRGRIYSAVTRHARRDHRSLADRPPHPADSAGCLSPGGRGTRSAMVLPRGRGQALAMEETVCSAFTVFGDAMSLPDELSAATGITPTQSYRLGEINRAGRPWNESCWHSSWNPSHRSTMAPRSSHLSESSSP